MSYMFWLITWLVGAFLILAPCILTFGRADLPEGAKALGIAGATLLWPIAMVYSCLSSWRQVLVGK